MSRSWNRIETWLALMVGGVGLLILGIAGLWIYVSATATPIHPNAQDVTSVPAATPVQQWAGAVEQGRQIVRAALAEQNLPGVSVAVGVGGEIAWAEGFGWANLENRVPVAPDMKFRIGTASVALTSAAAGLLLENSRLNLDDVIQKYVPEFPEKQWPLTLRQVMGHTAGIRNDGGDESPLFSQRCARPVDALPHFAGSSLRFEPGTEFRYSRFGWIVVSAAVEAAADESLYTFMRKRIFEPLGMNHTEPDLATEAGPDRATPYFPRFAADPRYGPDLMRPLDYSCYAGAAAFLSTPSDLVRFGMAIDSRLRQDFGAQGGPLLKPATVQLLQTSQRLTSGQETGYGLGWDIEPVTLAGEQTRAVGYDGDSLGGVVASLMTFPDQEHGVAVSVISNTSYADTFAVGLKIAQAFVEQGSPARK